MASSKIRINTGSYVGEYELDIEGSLPTKIEWHWIKKIAEYFPLTVGEGLKVGDPDLFVALAVIALYRAGRIQKHEALQVAESFDDIPFDGEAITFIGGGKEDDPTLASQQTPENASEEKTSDLIASSGNGSSESSDVPANDLSLTGDQTSGTPTLVPAWDRETSAS